MELYPFFFLNCTFIYLWFARSRNIITHFRLRLLQFSNNNTRKKYRNENKKTYAICIKFKIRPQNNNFYIASNFKCTYIRCAQNSRHFRLSPYRVTSTNKQQCTLSLQMCHEHMCMLPIFTFYPFLPRTMYIDYSLKRL